MSVAAVPVRLGLGAAVVALLVGPTALVLGLHRHTPPDTPPPAAVRSTRTPTVGPSDVVTWTTTPAAVAVAGRPPAETTAELPPVTTLVPALTHAAFRPARATETADDPPAASSTRWWSLDDPLRPRYADSKQQIAALLTSAPEVGLVARTDGATRLFASRPSGGSAHPVLAHFDNRTDLQGLPVLRGEDCRQAERRAGNFGESARTLRQACGTAAEEIRLLRRRWRSDFDRTLAQINPEQAAPLMLQMLQCESAPFRELLIDYARNDPRPETTRILAQRALFDQDAGHRKAAVTALAGRVIDPARPIFLAALHHPWPFVADRAAEALKSLRDTAAVPQLVNLLDQPDPTAPFASPAGPPVVREVVKINHARNCQLCHAPSWDASDPARVAVPHPDQPLPSSFSTEYYSRGDVLVRADVTYLRQDFSMTLPVADPGPWPREQRFDFFVRERPLSPGEVNRPQGPDRHRAAVLRTLRGITGRDFGDTADEWRAGLKRGAWGYLLGDREGSEAGGPTAGG